MPRKVSFARCAGCRVSFKASHGEVWCPACASSVREVVVGFSADELKRLESASVVRASTVPEVIREAVHLLVGRKELPKRRNA